MSIRYTVHNRQYDHKLSYGHGEARAAIIGAAMRAMASGQPSALVTSTSRSNVIHLRMFAPDGSLIGGRIRVTSDGRIVQ